MKKKHTYKEMETRFFNWIRRSNTEFLPKERIMNFVISIFPCPSSIILQLAGMFSSEKFEKDKGFLSKIYITI